MRSIDVMPGFAVAHHRHARVARGVERRPNGRRPAVHHVARADTVGTRIGGGPGHRRQSAERSGEIDAAIPVEKRAMAVIRRRAQADIDPERHAIAKRLLDGLDGSSHVVEVARYRRLDRRHRKKQKVPNACVEVTGDDIVDRGSAQSRVVAETRNQLRSRHAIHDEEGLDQVGDRERRLGHEVAHRLRLSQAEERPSRTESRIAHAVTSRCHAS
jgi:hypothetical protein